MSDKLEILKMIESGQITVDEGLQMIEALEQTEKIEDDIREEIYSREDDESKIIERELYSSDVERAEVMKDFDVSLTTCKMNIERSNVDDVTVEIMDGKTRELISKPEWLHIVEEKNTIMIKESRVTNLTDILDFFKSGSTLQNNVFINIKLPMEAIVDKGKFASVSGSISIIGIKAVDLEIRSVSGKVYAVDVKTKTAQLKSTSGSVVADNFKTAKGYLKSTSGKVKFSGSASLLECKTVSGAVEVNCGEALNTIVGSSVSGKITLHLESPEHFNLKLNSVSGAIDTSGFAVVDKSSSGKKSVNIMNRSDTKLIEASTVSGKIVIDRL